MLSNFYFAFHAVIPILALTALGYWIKRSGLFTNEMLPAMNTFAFQYGLSVLMFCNVYSLPSIHDIPLNLMLYTLGSLLLITLLYIPLSALFTKQRSRRGVLIQTGFRSNYAVIGAALASTLCGTEGQLLSASIQAPSIIYYNVAAVFLLTIYSNSDGHRVDPRALVGHILHNPLIIGLFCGVVCLAIREFIPRGPDGTLAFSLSGTLPFLYAPLKSLSQMATPLILIIMGAQFDFCAVAAMKKEIAVGVVLRLVVTPILGFTLAFAAQNMGLISLTPAVAATLLALYASPVAVAGASMAERMNCDGELARQHVVWTSIFSMITLFLWIVLFRSVGLF